MLINSVIRLTIAKSVAKLLFFSVKHGVMVIKISANCVFLTKRVTVGGMMVAVSRAISLADSVVVTSLILLNSRLCLGISADVSNFAIKLMVDCC